MKRMAGTIPFALMAYYLAVCAYLRRGLKKLQRGSAPHHLRFSVIIAAHNEEQCIASCLSSVVKQSISADRFEIILANDRSTDRTRAIAEGFHRYSNFSIVDITSTPPGFSPKKHALIKAIEQARHEIIVFTDADCVVPRTWLETLDRYFEPDVGLVQGITSYTRPAGMSPLFFGLQSVEFLSHGIVAAASMGAGMALNSNANNFAFRRRAFDEVGGYDQAGSVISGDDDLLLQRIWHSRRWRLCFMTDQAGSVTTRAAATGREAFEQRKRWGSKTVHYRPRQVALLGGVFLFYCGILAAAIAAPFSGRARRILKKMACAKLIGEHLLMWPGTALFGKKTLRGFIIPASLLHLPVVIGAVLIGVFGKFEWRNQRFSRTAKK